MNDEHRIKALFSGLLARAPSDKEVAKWSELLTKDGDFFSLFEKFRRSKEFAERNRVTTAWSPGHFYSPVVDPETVRSYVEARQTSSLDDISGINIDVPAMLALWTDEAAFVSRTPFRKAPVDALRFSWEKSPYPIGDATTYRMLINHLRPQRIVEVGSGYSTACALDTLDELQSLSTELTCIEPFPAALLALLRDQDRSRLTILDCVVQDVALDTFAALEKDDILFIDSTHVLKTGSDVHYEFFHILPILKPGVFVHFHDVRWPFEYPSEFIFLRNFSWNEAYALRAFLMYNMKFSVFFYNSLFAALHAPAIRETFPDFLINAGSSIWLKVQ